MRRRIAQLVHPVLAHGLQLRRCLRGGREIDVAQEQAIFKDMLLSDFESLRWAEFGGDAAAYRELDDEAARDGRKHAADHFLGVRYLLTCWLDETFCNEPACANRWNERKLEMELYGTNDRAWKFWEQAAIARSRPGTDAIEVAYLCVALGFRGRYRDDHQSLRIWIDSAKRRLGKVDELAWKPPTDFLPPAQVKPLRGRDRLRQTAFCAWGSLVVLIPLFSAWLIHVIGS